MPLEFIRQTAVWSNAVLTAMLPHFSDCAKQLNLPIPTPITTNMVVYFAPPVFKIEFQAAIVLTNSYWFDYFNGAWSFRSRDDWYAQQEITNAARFVGKDNMTTKEAIELARSSFVKLRYKLADFHMDEPPTQISDPIELRDLGHVPFCRLIWTTTKTANVDYYRLDFHIDLKHKRLAGMSLISQKLWRPPPKVDAVPELTDKMPTPRGPGGQTW